MELTQFPPAHVVDLDRESQTGEKMNAGESDPEGHAVLEYGENAQEDDESQNAESGVCIRIDVRMPRLVDFQHAQHRYGVHKCRICKPNFFFFYPTNEQL